MRKNGVVYHFLIFVLLSSFVLSNDQNGYTCDEGWTITQNSTAAYEMMTDCNYWTSGMQIGETIVTVANWQSIYVKTCTVYESPSGLPENDGARFRQINYSCPSAHYPTPPPLDCQYPYYEADVNGTLQCVLPPYTQPDGTCDSGYAKDTNNTCSLDDDGDGVPNSEDDFPTDPNRTDGGSDGSNNDSGKDCSAYCGIDNPQDCMDSISLSSSRTPIAEVGYIDCSDCVFRVDEQFGLTCDEFFGQQAEEPLPEIDDCSHENSLLGFAFQSITPGNTECTLLIKANAENGKGFKSALKNCSQGNTACFYNLKVADEEITDSNTSDSIDDTALVQKLDEVKTSIDDLNLPLNNIDDSIKQNTEILKNSLDSNFNDLKTSNSKGFGDVEKSVTEGTNTIGTKIDSMNDNIGTKLNGITDAINNKETFPQESEGILQYDDIEVDSMLGGSNSGLEAQFNSFTEGYATDLFSLQSVTLPVSPNCGCTDPSIDVVLAGHSFHQDVEVCSSLDSLFAVMRPLLWFAFLVTTLFGFFRKD